MPETPAYVLDDLLSPTSLGDNTMPETPVLLGDGLESYSYGYAGMSRVVDEG